MRLPAIKRKSCDAPVPRRGRGLTFWALLFSFFVSLLDVQGQIPPPRQRQVGRPLVLHAQPTEQSDQLESKLGVGRWIWTTNFTSKQTCRLWRAFTIPDTDRVRKANLRITADDYYVCYLDGREIGRGGNWDNLTDYDVTWLLEAGKHVLAVEAVNDLFEGGVLVGLQIQMMPGEPMQINSDASWRIVPEEENDWLMRTKPGKHWLKAQEVGVIGQFPWWEKPATISAPSPLQPVRLRFWQKGWFITLMLVTLGGVLAVSLVLATKVTMQSRARRMLAQERVRIARDMHDDLGSALTQVVLLGEVAQMEVKQESPVRARLLELCEKARQAAQTLDEVIWTVNSQRDNLHDLTSYLCKYAKSYLDTTPIRCRMMVQADLPTRFFDLTVRRGLLLAVKEALNNAVKHSQASELFLRINQSNDEMIIVVEDDGCGFDPDATPGERNGFVNQRQRMQELGGRFQVSSQPGSGCRVEIAIPLSLSAKHPKFWLRLRPGRRSASPLSPEHQPLSDNSNPPPSSP